MDTPDRADAYLLQVGPAASSMRPGCLSRAPELCAVTALEQWLNIVGTDGPVFRTFDLRGRLTANRIDPSDVARVLRRRAAAAGVAGDFAGLSLRRGFITNAAKKKIPIETLIAFEADRQLQHA